MSNKYMLVGNFKMNLTDQEYETYFKEFRPVIGDSNIVMLPSVVSIKTAIKNRTNSNIHIGAQDVAGMPAGAYTGQVSAAQLASVGCDHALIGNWEMREYRKAGDAFYLPKIMRCLENNIKPIVCLQEYLQDSESGQGETVLSDQFNMLLGDLSAEQLSKTCIVYEPVWAIGTGLVATPDQAEERCVFFRNLIAAKYGNDVAKNYYILYGGSVNNYNARELLSKPNIDGFLTGGITLKVYEMMGLSNLF